MSEVAPTLAVGVCVLPAPPKNAPRTVNSREYIHEILGHAGLAYSCLAPDELIDNLATLRILVTIGEEGLDTPTRAALSTWVYHGGAWIAVGGTGGADELFGVKGEAAAYALWGGARRTLGEGYLSFQSEPAQILSAPLPLHFFSGAFMRLAEESDATVLALCLDAHGRPTDTPGLVERRVGAGRCLLIAPDLPGTVVHIQQGRAVTRDGIPASDGTGALSDGVLKSDDGQVLDWLLDRTPVPGVEGLRVFSQPIADQWRALLLRAIFNYAGEAKVALPLLWYHAHNHIAVGHVSHDTDGNIPELAWSLLRTLKRADIHSTWCTILPGYEADIIDAIRTDGHELATHFDTITDGCLFTEDEFDRQWQLLCSQFGTSDAPVTNKNHYLRWEGDTEFFEWCIRRGIRLDQSKGASKTGEAGFNFGTCHLYRPVAPDGQVLSIHELPTPTQDLLVFAPQEIVPPLLEAVCQNHGVLHLLFHPAHIDKPGVADSLVGAVEAGRQAGIAWKTGRELVDYEEARREARWEADAQTGQARLTAVKALRGATILVLDPKGCCERFGFRFRPTVCDLAPGDSFLVEGEGS